MPEPFRIRDLPADERPRERLARAGPSALSSDELLALSWGSGAAARALSTALAAFSRPRRPDGLASLTASELARDGLEEHAPPRRIGDRSGPSSRPETFPRATS